MSTYVEDLVQEIYTKCDMSGLDKLNQGLQDAIGYSGELEKNLRDAQRAQKQGFDFHARAINASKEAYKIASLGEKLNYQKARERQKLAEQQEKIDERRQHRQDKYNRSLMRQNGLLGRAGRLLLAYFSFRTFKGMFDTASRLQLVQKSIQGLTKSTQDWDYIQKQAFEKGIDIEVVAKGYRNFYSSAKMAGFDKGGIQQMYADMLLSTRAIGATTQQTEGALLALEQILSKQTLSMEELRRQLGNALPGAFEIGAKAMNMTTKEFNEFIKAGKIAANDFVPKFVAQLKKEYAGGFKDVAETLNFATTRFSVAWKLFQFRMFEGESGKAFARAIDTLAKLLISPEFERVAKAIGKIFEIVAKLLKFAIENISFVIALLGSLGLTKIIIKLTSLIGDKGVLAVMKLTKATALLYAQWLLVFGLVAAIQDLIYGIFLPDYTDSITERILKKLGIYKEDTHQPASTEINKQIEENNLSRFKQGELDPKTGNYVYIDKDGMTRVFSTSDFYRRSPFGNINNPSDRRKFIEKYGTTGGLTPHQPFYRGADPHAIPTQLNREETRTLQMGDVNIYVQGNKEPSITAQEVYNSFFSLRRRFFQDK